MGHGKKVSSTNSEKRFETWKRSVDLFVDWIEIAWLFAAGLLLGRSPWLPCFNIGQIRFLDKKNAGDFCCLQSLLVNQLKNPLTTYAQNLGGLWC
jgi:hypothetical protein